MTEVEMQIYDEIYEFYFNRVARIFIFDIYFDTSFFFFKREEFCEMKYRGG